MEVYNLSLAPGKNSGVIYDTTQKKIVAINVEFSSENSSTPIIKELTSQQFKINPALKFEVSGSDNQFKISFNTPIDPTGTISISLASSNMISNELIIDFQNSVTSGITDMSIPVSQGGNYKFDVETINGIATEIPPATTKVLAINTKQSLLNASLKNFYKPYLTSIIIDNNPANVELSLQLNDDDGKIVAATGNLEFSISETLTPEASIPTPLPLNPNNPSNKPVNSGNTNTSPTNS